MYGFLIGRHRNLNEFLRTDTIKKRLLTLLSPELFGNFRWACCLLKKLTFEAAKMHISTLQATSPHCGDFLVKISDCLNSTNFKY